VKLEKGAQKANWALRPLTERMERYARSDTHYLKPLSDRLKEELNAKNRLSWHHEWCAQLIAESGKAQVADPDAWRLKGSHLLERPALAVLRELWHWREHEAIGANRPPFFILSHELMVKVAGAAVNGDSFDRVLPRHISERRRTALHIAVNRGLAVAPEHQPRVLRSKSRRPTEAERRRFSEFEKRRDTAAERLGLDATVIASRGTLSDLAYSWERHAPELMNWQRKLLEQ
jgi:ribonuclease D